MNRFIFLSVFFFFSVSSHALNWSNLWHTPDQQAQKYMQDQHYEKAQNTFERKDWAAAAAYRAQNYQKAAEDYATLHNEEGYYNLGNALAKLHRYPEAIKAYEKALILNPQHQDAQFNRQLIKALLKEQQNKEQQNKEQQNKEQQNKEQQNKEQQNKEQQNKEQQNKEQQNKEQQNKEQQNKEQQNKEQQNKEQQNKEQQNKEQQQAKEQWLRLIPDDPGGLLREKFLRDHLRRQQGWGNE